jgi:UDP-N-acetyl-D-glucosamine dehydrogenase
VNIALANELAMVARALGISIWDVIDAAATKPYGFMAFTPGPGVGGHCLPIDPAYLSWQVERALGQSFRFIDLANDVNSHMPHHVVERVTGMLNTARLSVNGARILVLGLAYKAGTSDIRESPSLKVIELLTQRGAEISVLDPWVDPKLFPAPACNPLVEIRDYDLVVLLTDHEVFTDELAAHATRVLDCRRHLKPSSHIEYL